jgi:hypothetical protein
VYIKEVIFCRLSWLKLTYSPVLLQKAWGLGWLVGGILALPAPAQNHPFTLIG